MNHDASIAGEPLDLEFGKFVLHRAIAPSGDAGVVFSAHERVRTATSRKMAVTILDPRSIDQIGLESRVEAWAVAASVSHPVLHRVADFGEHAGLHYFVTPWLDGWNLRDISRSYRDHGEQPSVAAVASLGVHLAEALAYLHEIDPGTGSDEAMFHGRLAPSRVIVMRSGHIKLLGFGVSPRWSVRYAPRPTSTGSQAYLAPEQLRSDLPDPRTDIYALSLLLHSFHAGSNPLERDTLEETTQAILDGFHEQTDIAPELTVPLLPGLALEPGQRPSSVRWLAAQLQRTAVQHGGMLQSSDWRVLLQDLFADEDERAAPELSEGERELVKVVLSEVREVAVPAGPDLEETEVIEGRSTRRRRPDPVDEDTFEPDEDEDSTDPQIARRPEAHDPSPPSRGAGWATLTLVVLGALIVVLLALIGGVLVLERLGGSEVSEPEIVVDEGPDPVGVYLDEAQRLLDAKDVAAARAVLDTAREAGTVDPALNMRLAGLAVAIEREAHLLTARTHLETGEHEEAMGHLRAVLDANPSDPEALELTQQGKAAIAAEAEAEAEAERPPTTRRTRPAREATRVDPDPPDPSPSGTGAVTVRSQPQSMVYIDGAPVGTTPLVDYALPVGSHTVVFKLGGRGAVTRTVIVEAGGTAEVEVTLTPE